MQKALVLQEDPIMEVKWTPGTEQAGNDKLNLAKHRFSEACERKL